MTQLIEALHARLGTIEAVGKATGLHPRQLERIRDGKSQPRRASRQAIIDAAARHEIIEPPGRIYHDTDDYLAEKLPYFEALIGDMWAMLIPPDQAEEAAAALDSEGHDTAALRRRLELRERRAS